MTTSISLSRRESGAHEGVVTRVAPDQRVDVQSVNAGPLRDVRVALPGYRPELGDRVLVMDASSSAFIIGVVASRRGRLEELAAHDVTVGQDAELRTGSVSARVEDGSIVVRSADGSIVLTHDPERGETRLCQPAGDLVLEAPAGTMRLKAKELEFEAEQITQRADRVLTVASHIGWSADRWELRVNRIKERAREVYRDVDEVLSTRAGRLRTVVRTSAQLLAKRTTIRSKEDTSIDGRQVLLG